MSNIDDGLSEEERRLARRLPMSVEVEYEATEDFLVDYTANLSIGGMFIRTSNPMEVGTRFKLRFKLPQIDRRIITVAEVRWALTPDEAGPMTPGMGVSFGELSSTDRSEVERLLQEWD